MEKKVAGVRGVERYVCVPGGTAVWLRAAVGITMEKKVAGVWGVERYV